MSKSKGLQFDLGDAEAIQKVRTLSNKIIMQNAGEDSGTMTIACLDVCIRMVKGNARGMTTVDAIERLAQILVVIADNEQSGKALKQPVSG